MNNNKIKDKDNKKENCLYTYESNIDSNTYKQMVKYFPHIYWTYVYSGTIVNIILFFLLIMIFKGILIPVSFLIIYQIYIMIIYNVRLEHYAEQYFKISQKKGKIDLENHLEFYEDYFTYKKKELTNKINYSDIDRCVETNEYLYLKPKKEKSVIIIQKNKSDSKLIDFLSKKINNIESNIDSKINNEQNKKVYNPKFIEVFMLLLCLLTVGSIFGAIFSSILINIKIPQYGLNILKNTWIFWCWLPIPILSIVLGIKYSKLGFKCTSNIIAGFIVGFILLPAGALCLKPSTLRDYSELNEYKSIIDAQLPNNGVLEIIDSDSCSDKDKTNCTTINAYYDKEDVSELEKSIINNDHWIARKDMDENLKSLIPNEIKINIDSYVSFYNKTTNEYNTLPKESGEYEIYVMVYDKTYKILKIHKSNNIYS